MLTVQVLVEKDAYAAALSSLLLREGAFEVARVAEPDFRRTGVIVADRKALERYPALLQHPERLVLIAPNDPAVLSALWEHDVRSVVFDTDPPSTAVLAILGAELREGKTAGTGPAKGRIVVLGRRAPSPTSAGNSPKIPIQ